MERTFRDKTEDGLVECARWLSDNAAQLADTIDGGCTHWEVAFRWDAPDDTSFSVPRIRVVIDKVDRGVIDAYI